MNVLDIRNDVLQRILSTEDVVLLQQLLEVLKKTPDNRQKELELIKKINAIFPNSLKRRQKQLYKKMQEDTLLLPEKEELVLLNNLIEEKTAEKIAMMGELAKLKNLSLEQLTTQYQTPNII